MNKLMMKKETSLQKLKKISDLQKKEILNNNDFKTSSGLHGQIFVTPINKGNTYMKSFASISEAFEYYSNFYKLKI